MNKPSDTSAHQTKSLAPDTIEKHRKENVEHAHLLAQQLASSPPTQFCDQTLDIALKRLRWFAYPVEAVAALRTQAVPPLSPCIFDPFQPQRYMQTRSRRQSAGASGTSRIQRVQASVQRAIARISCRPQAQ